MSGWDNYKKKSNFNETFVPAYGLFRFFIFRKVNILYTELRVNFHEKGDAVDTKKYRVSLGKTGSEGIFQNRINSGFFSYLGNYN